MPRHFAHYYFSHKLTEGAPYALSAIVALYPDAYLLGSLGADLFHSEHRARLDVADPMQIFSVTARHIFMNGSKCQLSYMLGMVSHYALDRVANPFIDYFAQNGVRQYFGGKVETVSREDIEIGIDRHIIRDYLGIDKALEIVGGLKTRKIVIDEITELYMDILNDLPDTYMNSEGLGRLDYMDRENHEWLDRDKNKHTQSLDELLESEREDAYLLLEEYMAMARSNKAPDVSHFSLNSLGERV